MVLKIPRESNVREGGVDGTKKPQYDRKADDETQIDASEHIEQESRVVEH